MLCFIWIYEFQFHIDHDRSQLIPRLNLIQKHIYKIIKEISNFTLKNINCHLLVATEDKIQFNVITLLGFESFDNLLPHWVSKDGLAVPRV